MIRCLPLLLIFACDDATTGDVDAHQADLRAPDLEVDAAPPADAAADTARDAVRDAAVDAARDAA